MSRERPSARYRELMELYGRLHREGEQFIGLDPDSTYPGVGLMPHLKRIKELIDHTNARTILDYGSGKGYQYDPQPIRIEGAGAWDSVLDYWDVDEVRCYDPCYEPTAKLPTEKFDGVISTDVLEHCSADDLPWIAEEIFSFASRFVFVAVACYPAKSRLPNGENAHCTVRPVQWWLDLFHETAAKYPRIQWKIVTQEVRENDSD